MRWLKPYNTEDEARQRYVVLERLEGDCVVVTGAGQSTSKFLSRDVVRTSLQDDEVPDFPLDL